MFCSSLTAEASFSGFNPLVSTVAPARPKSCCRDSDDVVGGWSPNEASTCVQNINLKLSTSAEKHTMCCRCICLVEEEMLNRLLSERCDKHEAGEEDKEIQTTTTMPEPLPAFYLYANI